MVRDGVPAGLAFARTLDVSLGGALIEIAAPRSFCPGESVRVAILSDVVVIDPRAMVEATVVRVQQDGPGRQRVGVRFVREQSLPVAA
jgi:c-di-GMP-binding flagellar brake protein YcgR